MKINQARGRDSFDVAAVRRDIKVGLENLVLAIEAFKFGRSGDLQNLSAQSSRVDAETNSRELHRDGGAADSPAATEIRRAEGAQQRDGIHSAMPSEPRVLLQQRRLDHCRWNFRQRHP